MIGVLPSPTEDILCLKSVSYALPVIITGSLKCQWHFKSNTFCCKSDAFLLQRYELLAFEELNCALMVTQKELFSLLSVSVPCVGCRRR